MTFAPRFTSATPAQQTLCAVQLIDRRTGAIHRMNGRPLLVVTRKPQDAATDLMAGRDPSVWEARIDTIEQIAR
jgi:hypothetical protein